MGIFDINCKKYDYEMEEDVRSQVRAMVVQRKLATLENFANARDVRNLFEEIITNQARRVALLDSPTKEDMKKILLEDLVETAEEDAQKTLKKAAETEKGKAADSEPGKEAEQEPEKAAETDPVPEKDTDSSADTGQS